MNLLVFRFANSVFENSWNKNFIEKIEIKLLEKVGAEKRGLLYDSMGALRDVAQNHLLQMLALITMEPPADLNPDSVKEKKTEILKSLAKSTPSDISKNTVRGQYKGYLNTAGVKTGSRTETYLKIKTFLNHPKWRGVPVYLETGKKMNRDSVEIVITFKERTPCLFCSPEMAGHRNTLCFRIEPKEGIIYCFFAKKPGAAMEIEKKTLHFFYQEAYPREKGLQDYERLIIDAFLGDQTLFVSSRETVASWQFIDPILAGWQKNLTPLKIYPVRSL